MLHYKQLLRCANAIQDMFGMVKYAINVILDVEERVDIILVIVVLLPVQV